MAQEAGFTPHPHRKFEQVAELLNRRRRQSRSDSQVAYKLKTERGHGTITLYPLNALVGEKIGDTNVLEDL